MTREAQTRRIVAGRVRFAFIAAADNDQRHAEAVRLILVLEPFEFVVRSEFEVIEILRPPDAAAKHASDFARTRRRVDGHGRSGPQFAVAASQPQRRFQGAVIKIARAAELGIVAVPRGREAVVEEIGIGMQHGRPVEIERLGRVLLVDLPAREIGQFGHGIDLVGRRFLVADRLQICQQHGRIALQGVGQVIDSQQLRRPRRRLRPAPRRELKFLAQRIAWNAAKRNPFLRRAAGEQEQNQQRNPKRKRRHSNRSPTRGEGQ